MTDVAPYTLVQPAGAAGQYEPLPDDVLKGVNWPKLEKWYNAPSDSNTFPAALPDDEQTAAALMERLKIFINENGGIKGLVDLPDDVEKWKRLIKHINIGGKPNLRRTDLMETQESLQQNLAVPTAGVAADQPDRGIGPGRGWALANQECSEQGIGSEPVPNSSEESIFGGLDISKWNSRCYLCQVKYCKPSSRNSDGAECEHIIPFYLLLLSIGIGHKWYINRVDEFFEKHGVAVATAIKWQGTPADLKERFKQVQRWIWGFAYRWSCYYCNQLKSNSGYIDIQLFEEFVMAIFKGSELTEDKLKNFLLSNPNTSEPELKDMWDKVFTPNLVDSFLMLLYNKESSRCSGWRKRYLLQI